MRRIRLGVLGAAGTEIHREGFIGTTAALLGGGAAAIGGGLAASGAIGGALIGAGASGDATDKSVAAQKEAQIAQEKLAREGMAYQEKQAARSEQLLRDFDARAQAQLKPFQDAQLGALAQLQGLSDPNNPLYQQQRDTNTQAIQRQLAAQGLLRSKNQVDLLSNMELGLNQQRANVLGGLVGLGAVQQGAQNTMGLGGGLAQLAGNLGANVGSAFGALGANQANAINQIGQTYAQGALARGQALGGAITGLGNIAQGTIGNLTALDQRQQDRQYLADLFDKMRGGGGMVAQAPVFGYPSRQPGLGVNINLLGGRNS